MTRRRRKRRRSNPGGFAMAHPWVTFFLAWAGISAVSTIVQLGADAMLNPKGGA